MSTGSDGVDWGAVNDYMLRHRQALGITKRDAANKAEVSPVTWRNLENGAGPVPREITLLRVAEALQRPPEELLELCGLPYRRNPPVRGKKGRATAESISADPALAPEDKRLLKLFYERLTRS